LNPGVAPPSAATDIAAEDNAFRELISQIESRIKSADEKRKLWRRRELGIWVGQALFASLTTILAGVQVSGSELYLKNGTLVASAIASFAMVVATRLRARERWIGFTRTASSLRALHSKLRLIDKLSGPARAERLSTEAIFALHNEMQKILDDGDAEWTQSVTAGSLTASKPA